jgi:RNA recognition motif-containing protein
MKIFVRGLPKEISPKTLRTFAETILTPAWYQPLRRRINIKSCVVLKMKDLDQGVTEFHGLMEITPYKAGIEAINLLNRQSFQGRLLEVRRWYERSDLNDRRTFLKSSAKVPNSEKRSDDRRRVSLVIETYEPPSAVGMKQFHREYD